jgi:ketosteroid isomerase-like protein
MSEENVETVRKLFEAVQEQDYKSAFVGSAVVSDFEILPAPEVPGTRRYQGLDGLLEFIGTWTEDFDDWSVDYERLIDTSGDCVVAMVHQRAVGKGSGVPVDQHSGLIFDFEDRRVVRLRFYLEPSEALEAAGLPE